MLDSVLTKDHERIDGYLSDFLLSLSSRPDTGKLELAMSSLSNHMFWEEDFLFPEIFKENELRIKGLEAEHGAITNLFREILNLLSKNDAENAKKKTEAVIRVLKGHNDAEEGYIYLKLDKLDGAKQSDLLLKEVERSSAPEGWVCRILRKSALE